MKFRLSRRAAGFTLIEIIVVIAILATLVAVSAPLLAGRMKAGELEKCRANVEQLSVMGLKYSQDMAHSHILPTSGMADDEDTEYIDESEGWWLSIAPEMDSVVLPQKKKEKMKISDLFHCPSDTRSKDKDAKGKTTQGMMIASPSTVSYVSWTDASEDPENPNSCIRTTAKQRLDELPWISDGIPVKGESVTDLASFRKMVRPAIARHDSTIIIAYAGGSVRAVKVDPEEPDEKLFRLMAPELAKASAGKSRTGKKAKKGKKGKKSGRSRAATDED